MALPDGCEVTATHLVFWELAPETQLADVDKLYEFCCTVACTNAFRPLGPVEVVRHPYPDIGPGGAVAWGSRFLAADAAASYESQGYVLCELRLPVQPMGSPVPPGISESRPAGTS